MLSTFQALGVTKIDRLLRVTIVIQEKHAKPNVTISTVTAPQQEMRQFG